VKLALAGKIPASVGRGWHRRLALNFILSQTPKGMTGADRDKILALLDTGKMLAYIISGATPDERRAISNDNEPDKVSYSARAKLNLHLDARARNLSHKAASEWAGYKSLCVMGDYLYQLPDEARKMYFAQFDDTTAPKIGMAEITDLFKAQNSTATTEWSDESAKIISDIKSCARASI